MRSTLDRITRRDALARIAGLTALASAATVRGEDAKAERPPARIYVTVPGRRGEVPQEVAGVLAVDPKDGTWVRVAPAGYSVPRVSPDGRKVLCLRQRPENGQPLGLHVCDASGEDEPKKIVDGLVSNYFWSPDGKQIVCAERRDGDGSRTVRIDADGSNRVELPIPATESVAAWSRDGRWFATLSIRGGAKSFDRTRPFYAMHPDGTGERLLVEGGEVHNVQSFTPDGRGLLFVAYELGETRAVRSARLEIIDLDGRNRRTLVRPRGRAYPIQGCWSPDGTELVVNFLENHDEAAERPAPAPVTTCLAILSADGKRSRPLDTLEGIPFGLWDWR